MWRVGRSTRGFVLVELILFQCRALEQLFLFQLKQFLIQLLQWSSRSDCAGAGPGFCPLQRIEWSA